MCCQGDAFNEHSPSLCTQSFTASCIQQWLPLPLLVAAWQLTSAAPCSSWSLFNKLGPPISSQPSGLSHRLPVPLGWPWCHLHVGVLKAQVTEYIYQRPRSTLPHLFNRLDVLPWGLDFYFFIYFFFSLTRFSPVICSWLQPSVSLATLACTTLSHSRSVSVSPVSCSQVWTTCGWMVLIRWLSRLLCD